MQLEQRYRDLLAEISGANQPVSRIRLALLLSHPGAPFHDYDRATSLLESLVLDASPDEAATADFGRLVYSLLKERSCVDTENSPLAEMLIAERERSRSLDEDLAEARASLAAERAYRQTLQGQLDALKSLEEQISLGEGGNRN